MRSKTKQKLASALMATCLGVGWVSAGNLDQLNYGVEPAMPGNTVESLRQSPNSLYFPSLPYVSGTPFTVLGRDVGTFLPETFIATADGSPQNSATMVRGYLEPPQTGDYVFWVSGNDDAEFWLSSTPGSAGAGSKTRRALTAGSTGVNSWATRLSQKSDPIMLEAGKQYYFEMIQKTGGAVGGRASIGWWLPDLTLQRPIPIRYAQRFVFDVVCTVNGCAYEGWTTEKTITNPIVKRGPGGATISDRNLFVTEGQSVDLSVAVDANYPVAFQWYSNGVAEAGAVTSTKYIEELTSDYDGVEFYLVAGGTTTKTVTLIQDPDTTSPSVISASTAGNDVGFSIVFSENVDPATATDKANYTMNFGVVVDNVEMQFGAAKGNTVVLTTTPPPTQAGTQVTIKNVTDTSAAKNPIPNNTIVNVALTDGVMTYKAFGAINGGAGIGGVNIRDFAYNVVAGVDPADWVIGNTNRFPNAPDVNTTVTQAAIRDPNSSNPNSFNFANNYGAQLVGFITPPVTGDYNFAIAADDQAILMISTDQNPANKYPIAIEPIWRPYRAYTASDNGRTGNNAYRTQVFGAGNEGNITKSAAQSKNTVGGIPLVAGNKYYFEALMKEAGGGDNLDVTWQLPNTWNYNDDTGLVNGQAPIQGQYLSLFVPPGQGGPIEILTQPADVSILENRPASMNIVHKGSPPYLYQWYKNGSIIPDYNDREMVFPRPSSADDGAVFSVAVRNLFSEEVSTGATLTVIKDEVAPGIVRAIGSATYTQATVQFDEIIDPVSAVNQSNYSINGLTITGPGTLGGLVNDGYTTVTFPTSPQTPGTVYTVTVNGVKDIAEDPNSTAGATKDFTAFKKYKGIVLGQIYRGIGGTAISALTSAPNYPASPDETVVLTHIGFPESLPYGGDNYGDNFGIRISGELQVPSSGQWRFFTRSDDAGQFFLNTTDANPPAETNPIAREDGCCAGYQEPPAPETSAPITLVAGKAYGFTYLVKEGGGGDWGGVAMRKEGDNTPSGNLTAINVDCCAVANPDETAFTLDPQIIGGTFSEGTPVTFVAGGSGTNLTSANPPVYWSWQVKRTNDVDWVDIGGAHSSSYTTPRLLPSDNGSQWRPVATIPGRVTEGDPATLTVTPDSQSPSVTTVSSTPEATHVYVYFDEPVETVSAQTLGNYVITGPASANVAITAAVRAANGLSVKLTTAPIIPDTQYSIAVQNVTDTSFGANVMNPFQGTFTGWRFNPGKVLVQLYYNLGGVEISTMTNAAVYPDSPNFVSLIDAIDTPPSDNGATINPPAANRENFGIRMTGFLVPKVTEKYYFAISGDDHQEFWLSTNADPANKRLVVAEPQWNGWRSWNTADRRVGANQYANIFQVTTLPINRSDNTVKGITLTEGEAYYFEALGKEGGGGDSCAVTWWMEGETIPADNTTGIPGEFTGIFVNPDNTIAIASQPQSQNAELGASVTLSVAAAPTAPFLGGPVTYQWNKAGTPIVGATGPTLALNNLQAGDFTTYNVVMTAPGAPETTSATATLSQGVIPGDGPTLAIVNNGDGSVTVSYPAADAAANQLQSTLSLADPITFSDDTTGAINGGSFETTKTTDTDSETYWRTAPKP